MHDLASLGIIRNWKPFQARKNAWKGDRDKHTPNINALLWPSTAPSSVQEAWRFFRDANPVTLSQHKK